MKTALHTCLVIASLGFFTNPAASMESKSSSTNTATPLDGVISRSIVSGSTIVETNTLQLDRIKSLNLSESTTQELLETDTALEPPLRLTTEQGGEPITNSAQIPLIQF